MRIAMLSWESLHSIAVGGLAAHVSELAAALSEQGHEVHVFTRVGPEQDAFEIIDGVQYHRCAYAPRADFVDDMNEMCRAIAARVLAIEDETGPFDVVHAHDWLVANAMIWIKQVRGRRCVLTIHSTEYGRCGNTFPDGIAQRIREQERAGTYWADSIIAVSRVTADEVRWLYDLPNWKIGVVYNGVHPERFDSAGECADVRRLHGIGVEDPVVLYCGRVVYQKGPDLLLEAVPSVLEQHARAKFLFTGDGEMRGGLEGRAREMGVASAVRFLGHRTNGDLPRLFKTADLVCVPSRNEPFGIVVLEAWSAGKPVVVSHVGGPREYVRDERDGLQVQPEAASIAGGINALLADPSRARRMGLAGRAAVDARFCWNRIAHKTMAVYDPDYAAPAAEAETGHPASDFAVHVPSIEAAESGGLWGKALDNLDAASQLLHRLRPEDDRRETRQLPHRAANGYAAPGEDGGKSADPIHAGAA